MKRMLISVVLLASISLVFCGFVLAQEKAVKPKKEAVGQLAGHQKTDLSLPAKPQKEAVEASGAALWDHLKKVDYTKKWKMWPGKTALYKGTEPHGALLTTYVNGTALKAIKGKKGKLPVGSIIAKENYMPDNKLAAITVMYKVEGYNPETGDWFWAKYAPDGKIEAEGKVEMCVKCHSMKKDNDFVYTGTLK